MTEILQLRKRWHRPGAGFTLVELLIASFLLLVGIVAVAQLVPYSMELNFRNRYESTALILAQRQLEQMMMPRLTASVSGGICPGGNLPSTHYGFCDRDGAPVALGRAFDGANPAQDGCPVTSGFIDFSQDCTAQGYRKTHIEGQYSYELRWRVITTYTGSSPTVKRIMVAARGISPRLLPPTTLTVLVE